MKAGSDEINCNNTNFDAKSWVTEWFNTHGACADVSSVTLASLEASVASLIPWLEYHEYDSFESVFSKLHDLNHCSTDGQEFGTVRAAAELSARVKACAATVSESHENVRRLGQAQIENLNLLLKVDTAKAKLETYEEILDLAASWDTQLQALNRVFQNIRSLMEEGIDHKKMQPLLEEVDNVHSRLVQTLQYSNKLPGLAVKQKALDRFLQVQRPLVTLLIQRLISADTGHIDGVPESSLQMLQLAVVTALTLYGRSTPAVVEEFFVTPLIELLLNPLWSELSAFESIQTGSNIFATFGLNSNLNFRSPAEILRTYFKCITKLTDRYSKVFNGIDQGIQDVSKTIIMKESSGSQEINEGMTRPKLNEKRLAKVSQAFLIRGAIKLVSPYLNELIRDSLTRHGSDQDLLTLDLAPLLEILKLFNTASAELPAIASDKICAANADDFIAVNWAPDLVVECSKLSEVIQCLLVELFLKGCEGLVGDILDQPPLLLTNTTVDEFERGLDAIFQAAETKLSEMLDLILTCPCKPLFVACLLAGVDALVGYSLSDKLRISVNPSYGGENNIQNLHIFRLYLVVTVSSKLRDLESRISSVLKPRLASVPPYLSCASSGGIAVKTSPTARQTKYRVTPTSFEAYVESVNEGWCGTASTNETKSNVLYSAEEALRQSVQRINEKLIELCASPFQAIFSETAFPYHEIIASTSKSVAEDAWTRIVYERNLDAKTDTFKDAMMQLASSSESMLKLNPSAPVLEAVHWMFQFSTLLSGTKINGPDNFSSDELLTFKAILESRILFPWVAVYCMNGFLQEIRMVDRLGSSGLMMILFDADTLLKAILMMVPHTANSNSGTALIYQFLPTKLATNELEDLRQVHQKCMQLIACIHALRLAIENHFVKAARTDVQFVRDLTEWNEKLWNRVTVDNEEISHFAAWINVKCVCSNQNS